MSFKVEKRRTLQRLAALPAIAALPAAAQSASDASAALLSYEGADRTERIVAAAKKEGSFTWYTSFAEKDMPPIVDPVEKKYGGKGKGWRASREKVLQRSW